MNFKNLALGYVATAPSPATTGTSLTLDSGEGARFPQPSTDGNFYVTAMPPGENPNVDNSEILQVTARSTDTLTIVREQGDTTAKTIEAGWIILQSIYKENILDEDDMASDSATSLATQQSIKAYADSKVVGLGGIDYLYGGTTTGTALSGSGETTIYSLAKTFSVDGRLFATVNMSIRTPPNTEFRFHLYDDATKISSSSSRMRLKTNDMGASVFIPFSFTCQADLTSGSRTFYIKGEDAEGSNGLSIYDCQVSGIYIPSTLQ